MDNGEDVWVRYAPLIKRLYQEERKTLSEVKTILENEHSFPRTPLSTYETKLRGVYGLRKKLKADDWPRIYHYARAQGFKRFDVFLNGTHIPWLKAWKEIRRSGVTRLALPVDRQATLPDGVEVRKQPEATPQSSHPGPASHPRPHIQTQARRSSRRILPTPQPEQIPRNVTTSTCHSEVLPLALTPSQNVDDTLLSRRVTHRTPSSPGMNQFSLALRNQRNEVQSNNLRWRYLFAKINLENIPWNQYRLELQASRLGNEQQNPHEYWQFDGHLLAVMPADGFFGNRPDGFPVLISDTYYPTPGAPPAYFDLYHFLSHIVYLFSNNLHRLKRDDAIDLMHTLANQIPRTLIFKIFKSDSLSIRGLWQQLFNTALKHEVADGLALLITVALEFHRDWIHDDKDRVLYAAVLANDISLVQQLLAEGARLTYYKIAEIQRLRVYVKTAFDVAAKQNNIKCAKLLMDSCDPNGNRGMRKLELDDHYGSLYEKLQACPSIFSIFLLNFNLCLEQADGGRAVGYASRIPAYISILALMLEAGADVDSMFPVASEYNRSLYDDMTISLELRPTCLDICQQWDISLSRLLLKYSQRQKVELTRVGVMMAAQEGEETLTRYLNSVPTPSKINTAQYLELILAEQFSGFRRWGPRIPPISPVARTLIEYGISVRAPRRDKNRPLRAVVEAAAEYGLDENLRFLLRHLIERGAPLDSKVLSSAVASQGTALLEILIRSGADVIRHGFLLLTVAAYRRNEDAIDLLLNLGVDVNSEGRTQPRPSIRRLLRTRRKQRQHAKWYPRRTVVACLLTKRYATDVEIWQLLISKGAKLRLNANNSTCFELLRDLVEAYHWEAFSFVLQFEKEAAELSPFQWYDLLVVVMKKPHNKFITAIARRCEHPLPPPILVAAILANCEMWFIQELIGSGADINEFSSDRTPLQAAAQMMKFELVLQLLELGADVNAPARGKQGATALHFACGSFIRSTEDASRKSRLVRMLVAKGADVNAPAHGALGSTALQLICRDFESCTIDSPAHELFTFLLESGADVNAAPGLQNYTALQRCASSGRLAESALLIQHGADPNGYPCSNLSLIGTYRVRSSQLSSALDLAAFNGRLDMTQYLLNVGALSGNPGATGFQGAIDWAVKRSHHAVAEAIRRHVVKLSGCEDIKIGMFLAQYRHDLEDRKARIKEYLKFEEAKFSRGSLSEEENEEAPDEAEIDEGDLDEEVDFDIDTWTSLP